MNKKIVTIGTVCILAALCLAGASYAYLMDVEENKTLFTVGDVAGTLSTTHASGSIIETIPKKAIEAKPSIKLEEGSEDAIAFIEIELPVNKELTIYDQFGDLVTDGLLMNITTVDPDWAILSKAKSKKANDNNKVYVLGYKKPLNAANTETSVAFDYLITSNFVDSDALEGEEVVITGALVQRQGFGYDSNTTFQQGELEDIYSQISTQLSTQS